MKKVLITLMLFLCGTVFSATIDLVKISGNKRVPDLKILQYTVKQGSEFDLEEIDKSIRSLYQTGLFLNVSADLEIEDSMVVLVYNVSEKPFINKIYFEGNDEISEESLREKLTINEGEVFDKGKIESTIKELRAKYQDENFFNVKITYDIEERENNSVDLIFSIDEGKEAKVYRIEILGNEFYSDKKIKKTMETDEKGFFSWLTGSGKLVSDEIALDRERIRALYLNSGFMRVQVSEPEIVYNEDKTRITLKIRIVEGERYKVDSVNIKGNVHIDEETLLNRVTLKKGEYFSSEKFQKDIETLTESFTAIGYAFANIEPETSVDDEKHIVNITYHVDENMLYRIERIEISGNEKTRDRVIRRELEIAEGDVYSSVKIKRSKQNVQYLNYFEEVTLTEEPLPDNKMNLRLNVKEKPTGTFSIGAGYSTLDGFVGTLQIQKDNLFGLGYSLNLKGEFSSKRTDYTLSFTNKWLFDRPITFGFDLYNLERSYYDYTKKSQGGALRLGHPIVGRKLYMYYRFAYEMEDIYDIDDDASDYVKEQEGKTTVISFTPSIVYNTTNHPLTPSKGNKSKYYIKYAGGVLGGDNNYAKTGFESSQFFPLFWKFVGMVHGEIGYLKSLDDKPLPIDERFRLGGMYSVRGFKYGDISPKDENGYDYGGDKYVLFNVEVTFPISESANLMGVVFYDTGQVYDNGEAYFSYDLRKSAGFGFRWYSPIGPLRLEYGKKLDKKEGESSDRWDFSIGGMF
ncbi:MAG: outer membrane protein insertion porin family [Deferribacteres bacterium]|jgi:outer membrane protein insertion porin family|nr:outer membrane protein insertion porin family [Deferribacteres bacterium]